MILGFEFYLVLDGNGQEAVKFYENALDAKIKSLVLDDTKERINHGHLKVGNTDLFIADEYPPTKIKTSQVTLHLTLNDVEKTKEVFGKLQNGGQVIMMIQEQAWSSAHGVVTDKFGVTWIIKAV